MSSAIVLPVLGNNNVKIYQNCMGKCCPKKQHQNKQSNNKECNPFLACSAAAWLMVPLINVIKAYDIYLNKNYIISNDDRVVKISSTLFHPPNMS